MQLHHWITGRVSAISKASNCKSRGREFDPGQVPYLREIDHERISTVVLLPTADSRCCFQLQAKVYLVKLAQEKSVVR